MGLRDLDQLVGEWTLEATHPAFPGLVVPGTSSFEWLDGERFMIQRSTAGHPDFPNSLCVIGAMSEDDGERLSMHYYDSRGVHRIYSLEMSEDVLRIAREAPGFSQRLEARLSGDGDSFGGVWQLSRDDETWDDDLEITYRRAPTASRHRPDGG
jgi:hypothetical protein